MNTLRLFFAVLAFAGCSTLVLAETPEQANTSEMVQEQAININTAKANEFTRLKGIGQKKAQAIVQYRKINGPYSSLHDLLKVKGIGQKILLDNKAKLFI